MKIRINLLCVFLLAVFLGGCVGKSEKEARVYSDSCRTIYVDHDQKYKLSQLIDSVSWVQLSNDKDALVSTIDQLIVGDNFLLVRDMYGARSVKMFSKNGQYIRSIGLVGRGPNEYIEPTFMQLYHDQIVIYDQFSCKLLFYDMQGRVMHIKRTPFSFMQFHIFNPNQYIYGSLNCDNPEYEQVENYSLFASDSLDQITYTALYQKHDSYVSLLSKHNFFAKDSLLYYTPVYNDTIYTVSPSGTVNARFTFDFGDQTVPKIVRSITDAYDLNAVEMKGRYLFMTNEFCLNKRFLHFSYTQKRMLNDYIYFFDDNRAMGVQSRDDFFPLIFLNIMETYGDALVGYFAPSTLHKNQLEGWRKLPHDKLVAQYGEKLVELGMSIKSDDNLIITFYYPKQHSELREL